MQSSPFSYALVDFTEGPALELRGEIDAAAAPELRAGLSLLAERARSRAFVDLLRARFRDAGGVAAFVEATRSTPHDMQLVMVDPSPACALALNDLGIHDYEIWLP